MKKILLLIVFFVAAPFLARSEISVQTNGGGIEVRTGNPPPPPNPQVIIVRPSTPQVVERTTVVQPSGSSGCSLRQN